jgi:ADP-ribosylglycohydrolase
MWTDDTQLTLAVADSLIRKKGFDMADIAESHVRAMDESVVGWGGSTTAAVNRFRENGDWLGSGQPEKPGQGVGNGVAMKIAPLAVYLAVSDPNPLFDYRLRLFSLFTHATRVGGLSAILQAEAVGFCLRDGSFEPGKFIDHLIAVANAMEAIWKDVPHDPDVDLLLGHLLGVKECLRSRPDEETLRLKIGSGSCRVCESLPVSLYLAAAYPHSMGGIYEAASYGNDTDTMAAMVGPLIGLINGTTIIPQPLIDGLAKADLVVGTADRFADFIDAI